MSKRVALIEPLGDPGIGTYAHELAEALCDQGVQVDLYTNATAWTVTRLPRRHRVFPVLGSALLRQGAALRAPVSIPAQDSGWRPGSTKSATARRTLRGVRGSYLTLELAGWLRAMEYDLVWTQWPVVTEGRLNFWSVARAMGLRLAHTAHNVLPHERGPNDLAPYRTAYRRSQVVVVHSRAAEAALARAFPDLRTKVVVAPHGLYTAYPREPAARARLRSELGVAPGERLVLCFGGIRPYKNVEAVVGALALEQQPFRLLVAGRESGYPDSTHADPLRRTRRLVDAAGLMDRTHFRVGPFAYRETAAFFEAADIVALPYLEGYGSGILLLAMSFGKHVIATAAGGMTEYLQHYSAHDVVAAPTVDGVRSALRRADARLGRETVIPPRPARFEWTSVVQDLLPRLFDSAA